MPSHEKAEFGRRGFLVEGNVVEMYSLVEMRIGHNRVTKGSPIPPGGFKGNGVVSIGGRAQGILSNVGTHVHQPDRLSGMTVEFIHQGVVRWAFKASPADQLWCDGIVVYRVNVSHKGIGIRAAAGLEEPLALVSAQTTFYHQWTIQQIRRLWNRL